MKQAAESKTSFTQEQFENPYPDGIENQYWHRARNKIIFRKLSAHFKPGEKDVVLDIGCGRGITIQFLLKQGWNAIGCDLGNPAPISADIAPHLLVERDAFQLPESLRESVRCITLLDVLEHLKEPREFIQKCVTAFPACDYIFVTLPARNEIWSNYDEYYGHFQRYSILTAQALFEGPGFKVLGSGYFFHLLYFPALLLRLLNVKRSVVIKAPTALTLHSLLTFYFDFEERVLPSIIPGSSVYALVRIVRDKK